MTSHVPASCEVSRRKVGTKLQKFHDTTINNLKIVILNKICAQICAQYVYDKYIEIYLLVDLK